MKPPPAAPARARARATEARRRRILAAALVLFDARGYQATTMGDIARAADVARGTVFNHFRRKQSILVAWFAEEAESRVPEVAAAADPLAAVVVYLDALAGVLEAHPDRVVPMMFELLDPDVERSRAAFLALPLNDVLRDLLARAQGQGQVRGDVSHRRLARVLANTFVLTALQWAAYRRDRSLREELRRALVLAVDGMRRARPDQ